MSEENQTPVETPAPVETAPQTESTFEIDGKQLTAEEVKQAMYDARTQVENLENYKVNASKLINNSFADEAERMNSVKYLLQQEGYNNEQISAYLQTINNPEQPESEGQVMQEPTPQPQIDNSAYEQAMQEQQDRLEALEAQQRKMSSSSLKTDLHQTVDGVLTGHKDIQALLHKFNSLNPGENVDARMDLFKNEIMRETMDNLRERKNAGGIFDKSWFNEETNRAADSVVAKFRTVIGDPNRIQRSPETGSELSSFINSKPVDPPSYEVGDRVMGKGESKVKDYTRDALTRLAAEIDLGGGTKA